MSERVLDARIGNRRVLIDRHDDGSAVLFRYENDRLVGEVRGEWSLDSKFPRQLSHTAMEWLDAQ